MQIPKFSLWIGTLALCGGMTLHADDTPAQLWSLWEVAVTRSRAGLGPVSLATIAGMPRDRSSESSLWTTPRAASRSVGVS